MKALLPLSILMTVVSCQAGSGPKEAAGDTATLRAAPLVAAADTTEPGFAADDTSAYEPAWVVIADTGTSYVPLRDRMLALRVETGLPIDTMDRSWNVQKGLIALPDSSDDEIYAGDYYPRRMGGWSMSLEYLSLYQKATTEKTMALVAGIYQSKAEADSAFRLLRAKQPQAFVVPTEIYMGCLH